MFSIPPIAVPNPNRASVRASRSVFKSQCEHFSIKIGVPYKTTDGNMHVFFCRSPFDRA